MPQIGRVSEKFFTSLITRLGIKPPFSNGFEISNLITPVSIVDSDVPLTATSVPAAFDQRANGGVTVAPPANTVLGDTGPLPAGTYQFFVLLANDEASGSARLWVLQRRDAANASNIWSQILNAGAGLVYPLFQWRETLGANERIRVTSDPNNNASASSRYQVTIWYQLTG
jgi:hypothetical protein